MSWIREEAAAVPPSTARNALLMATLILSFVWHHAAIALDHAQLARGIDAQLVAGGQVGKGGRGAAGRLLVVSARGFSMGKVRAMGKGPLADAGHAWCGESGRKGGGVA